MKKTLTAAILAAGVLSYLMASAAPVPPVPSGFIMNSAVPQNAQINVGTVTVRGQLTAENLAVSSLTVADLSVASVSGSGAGLTGLDASSLAIGTAPVGRLVGPYVGITGLGTIAAGVWRGSPVGTQWGGTGQDLSATPQGYVPYFNGTGSVSVLPTATAGFLLQTNGAGSNPSWTGSPAVLGTYITGIPMANLISGNLPQTIAVSDASISTVSAAKVIGSIPGNSANINGILPLAKLAAGTLSVVNPASSVTVTGISQGYYGGTGNVPLFRLGTDGRVYEATQSSFVFTASQLSAGLLQNDVHLQASSILPGVVSTGVVVSSLNATGVVPAAYGGVAKTLLATVAGDGRLSSLSAPDIALPPAQIDPGNIPAGVMIPAAGILAGSLNSQVICSSLNATGVAPGTYGGVSSNVQVTVGGDGRVSSVNTFSIVGGTSTAFSNVDNSWSHAQTSISSWTFSGNVGVSGTLFSPNVSGIGTGLTGVLPGSLASGALASGVTISTDQVTGYAAGAGETNTFTSSKTLTAGLFVVGSATASYFYGNGSGLTSVPGTGGITEASTPTWTAPHVFLERVSVSSGILIQGAGPYNGTYGTTGALVQINNQSGVSDNPASGLVIDNQGSYGSQLDLRGTSGAGKKIKMTTGSLYSSIDDASGLTLESSSISPLSPGPALNLLPGGGYVGHGWLHPPLGGPNEGGILADYSGTVVNPTVIASNPYRRSNSTTLDVNGSMSVGGGVTITTVAASGAITMARDAALSLTGPTGYVTNQSSATFGMVTADGYGLRNFVVTASSQPVATSTMAVTDVGIATMTATFRGSRPQFLIADFQIYNGAAGTRSYTCQFYDDGVPVHTARTVDVLATTDRTIFTLTEMRTSVIGLNSLAVLCRTDNATGTQYMYDIHLTAMEF